MIPKRWLILAVFAALFSAAPLYAAKHTKDSLETVKKNMKDKKAVLLDVRELAEWKAGRLKDAKLMPLSKLRRGVDPKEMVKGLDKKTIVYCH